VDQPAVTAPLVVEAVGLRKSFRRGPEQICALRGATLTLRTGELLALVGPSGSGKTTLLNLLCGWEPPDAGRLTWAGSGQQTQLGSVANELTWDQLAIVPQSLGLIEELSVAENVELPLWLAGRLQRSDHAEVGTLLVRFGLARHADRLPVELSLGERQRAALARAMVLTPRLLLADEPTAHQDADWARVVLDALRWLTRRGSCCLIATHSEEFLTLMDRVLTIRDGELAAVSV
jgi:ABC-type lipoprotein export system ATPase subunit